MGRSYNNRVLTVAELLRLPTPILLCADRPDFVAAIAAAGYQTVSLNLPLARSLIGMPESDIRLAIGEKVRDALPRSEAVYLTDYEMLFDPRYEFDILRLFLDLSAQRKLIAKWCGTVDGEGDVLTYSEHGYEDYQIIPINGYNITIVR